MYAKYFVVVLFVTQGILCHLDNISILPGWLGAYRCVQPWICGWGGGGVDQGRIGTSLQSKVHHHTQMKVRVV